jgi:hypothetical protein
MCRETTYVHFARVLWSLIRLTDTPLKPFPSYGTIVFVFRFTCFKNTDATYFLIASTLRGVETLIVESVAPLLIYRPILLTAYCQEDAARGNDVGALLVLDTTSISVLGYEHDLGEPVIRKWNQR